MQRSDFYYDLPNEYIAQYPLTDRATSKLLILARESGNIDYKHFYNIGEYLNENDVLVLNNTKVIPARLFGKKDTGGKVEVFLLNQNDNGTWQALLRPSNRVKRDTQLYFEGNNIVCQVLDNPEGQAERVVRFDTNNDFWQVLESIGHTPLPPYIKRSDTKEDTVTYQTVFAEKRGAVAAPTAGLHFTPTLLDTLRTNGVTIVYLTLHVSYATFRPIQVENLAEHDMYEEVYEVEPAVARTLNDAKKDNKRIVACGTTTVRALESAINADGIIESGRRSTRIFIYPPYTFKVVNALITNFHLPESTLIMLVSAFAGLEHILHAYEVAKQKQYRFYSYGDAMFIE